MDRNRQTLAGFGLGDFDQPTDDVSPLHGQHIAEPLADVKRELQRRNEARIRFFAEAIECRIRPRLVAAYNNSANETLLALPQMNENPAPRSLDDVVLEAVPGLSYTAVAQ